MKRLVVVERGKPDPSMVHGKILLMEVAAGGGAVTSDGYMHFNPFANIPRRMQMSPSDMAVSLGDGRYVRWDGAIMEYLGYVGAPKGWTTVAGKKLPGGWSGSTTFNGCTIMAGSTLEVKRGAVLTGWDGKELWPKKKNRKRFIHFDGLYVRLVKRSRREVKKC